MAILPAPKGFPITPATGTSTPPAKPAEATVVPSLYSQAVAQAQADLAAQQAPLQAQQAASDAYYASRQTDATAEASALSKLLAGLNTGGNIQGAYQNAAQDQDIMGQAFAHGQSDALNNSASGINTLLDNIGAPSAQQVGGNIADAGSALAGIGGLLPAQSWEKAGAAQAAAADVLPAIAALQGQENYKSIGAQAVTAHSALDAQIADLAGKLPGDVQTNYKALQAAALDNAKFNETVRHNAATETAAANKITLAQNALTRPNDALSRTLGYIVDSYGNPILRGGKPALLPGYQVGANGQIQKIPKATAGAGSGSKYSISSALSKQTGLWTDSHGNIILGADGKPIPWNQPAAAPTQKERATAYSIAQDGFKGYTIPATSTKPAQVVPQKTYAQAMDTMNRNGIPFALAQKELKAAGYKPGVLGTPYPNTPVSKSMQSAYETALNDVGQALGGVFNGQPDVTKAPNPGEQIVKAYAFTRAASLGWNDAENLRALDQLWTRESNWSPSATNPNSGAAGIPQELGHAVPAAYATDYRTQIEWGLNYIKQRYGSPIAAWQHEQQIGWY